MKVAVIGMGYVGLVTAISLAEAGNEIIAIEKNSTKLEKLKLGISPIYEPNIQEYLKKYNMDNRIITVEGISATVKEAAEALGTKEERIAKTLSFKLKDKYIVVVTSGDAKIDNAKYRHTFGEKAHMVSSDEVEEKIGHPIGGVCPFALNEGVEVYLDESLKQFETVFPACGATNNAIEISIEELEKVTNYKSWVDVSKPKEN